MTYITQMFHDKPACLCLFPLITLFSDSFLTHKVLRNLRPQPVFALFTGLVPDWRSDVAFRSTNQRAGILGLWFTIGVAAMNARKLTPTSRLTLEDDVIVVITAVGGSASMIVKSESACQRLARD